MLSVTPKSILMIRLGALGDVIQTLPVATQLRLRFPEARIVWAIEDKALPLIQNQPGITPILFPKRKVFSKNPLTALYYQWKFSQELQTHHFDLALDLQGLFKSGWIAWASKAKIRAGFHKNNTREGNHLFLSHTMPWQDIKGLHKIDYYQSILPWLGIPLQSVDDPFGFTFTEQEIKNIRILMHRLRIRANSYIVLNIGTSRVTKRWRTEYYVELIRLLRIRYPKQQLLLCGGGAEDASIEMEILKQVQPGEVLSSVNKINLREFAQVVAHCSALISPDSLGLHLASALNKPAVGLIGGFSSTPQQIGNWKNPGKSLASDINCFPCRRRTCSHHSCMKDLTASLIFQEIEKILPDRN
ncbi:MAG: glycosyltransferase family 9 protein [Candidatus Cloacimonetes bacterium]|nr:glycosyltransferase family 9 protein [Candidatus Cloacimonadota bacterium]